MKLNKTTVFKIIGGLLLAGYIAIFVILCINSFTWKNAESAKSAYDLYLSTVSEDEEPMTLEEWLLSLKGTDGKDGVNGVDGKDGVDGVNGVDGKDGVDGVNGVDGKDGVDGVNGVDGKDGRSAYEIAVDNGFAGTVDEWLESLKSQTKTHDGEHEFYSYILYPSTCVKQGAKLNICLKGDFWNIEYLDVDDSNHEFQATVVPPTCLEGGYTLQVCKTCGKEIKVDVKEALGHDYVERVVNPTCEEDGYIVYTCSRCNDTYVVEANDENNLRATGHSGIENSVILAIVPEGKNICEDGYERTYVCRYCYKHVYKTELVPGEGHHIENGTVIEEPTETTEGKMTGECTVCGNTVTVSIPKLETPLVEEVPFANVDDKKRKTVVA